MKTKKRNLYDVDCRCDDVLSVGTITEKSDKPSRYRRKKGLRQLFDVNKNSEDACN